MTKTFTKDDLKKFVTDTVWTTLPENSEVDRVAMVNIINSRVDMCTLEYDNSDFTIPQPPRCFIKRNSKSITYRNDWCENEGDCETCSIADYYREGGIKLKN